MALLVVVATFAIAANAPAAEPFEAGVAVVDITPPVGYRMSGYFHERRNTGTHDPLHAKALVLRQGDTQAALVLCDIIGISPDVSSSARSAAERQTGIPAANILVGATHSHTGPLYFGAMRNHFHRLAVALGGSDPAETDDYAAVLAERIVEAIRRAQAALRPVQLASGAAEQTDLAFNRRFHMREGGVRFNPGKLNPNIVRVAGPVDPQVGIVLLRDAEANKPLAALSVFALHLDTVGGTEYAADYPYYLGQTLRGELGEAFVPLFGVGTCGDINHIDVTSREPQKGHAEAERIGTTLAATVLEALPKLAPSAGSLAVRTATVRAPLQQYGEEEIARARANLPKIGTRQLSFLDQVRTYKIVALQERGGTTIPLETQVFRLGPQTAVVGLPGEVFVELGLEIKQASPFAHTLVIELCNDAPGYLPTRQAFAEGSYETVNSRIQPGGGEQLRDAAIALLRQLKP